MGSRFFIWIYLILNSCFPALSCQTNQEYFQVFSLVSCRRILVPKWLSKVSGCLSSRFDPRCSLYIHSFPVGGVPLRQRTGLFCRTPWAPFFLPHGGRSQRICRGQKFLFREALDYCTFFSTSMMRLIFMKQTCFSRIPRCSLSAGILSPQELVRGVRT